MKLFFLFAVVAASFTQQVFARNGNVANEKMTIEKTTARFNAEFNGVTGVWDIKSQYSEVLFFWHGILLDAYYDQDGELIGTFHHVENSELPAVALRTIAKEYKGYILDGASFMEKPNEPSAYYVTVKSPSKMYILEVSVNGDVSLFKTLR